MEKEGPRARHRRSQDFRRESRPYTVLSCAEMISSLMTLCHEEANDGQSCVWLIGKVLDGNIPRLGTFRFGSRRIIHRPEFERRRKNNFKFFLYKAH